MTKLHRLGFGEHGKSYVDCKLPSKLGSAAGICWDPFLWYGCICCWTYGGWLGNPAPVEHGGLSHDLQGFNHPFFVVYRSSLAHPPNMFGYCLSSTMVKYIHTQGTALPMGFSNYGSGTNIWIRTNNYGNLQVEAHFPYKPYVS